MIMSKPGSATYKAARAAFISNGKETLGPCACGRETTTLCYLDTLCEVQATYLEVLWHLSQLQPRHANWVVQQLVPLPVGTYDRCR